MKSGSMDVDVFEPDKFSSRKRHLGNSLKLIPVENKENLCLQPWWADFISLLINVNI